MVTIIGSLVGFLIVTCLCCVCGPLGRYFFHVASNTFEPGVNFPKNADANLRLVQLYENAFMYRTNGELLKGFKSSFASYGSWAASPTPHSPHLTDIYVIE